MSYYIGLLSGTSVDSIDAAIVEISEDKIALVCTHEQKFSVALKADLQSIIKSQQVKLEQLAKTDSLLAFEFSQAIDVLLNKSDLNKADLTAIGSHGQTIFHQPNGNHTNTFQIGSPHKLAAYTGINIVTNFRNLDMAYGGQGAPLAPIIHQILFSQDNRNTAVINLGGITNISFVGKDYNAPTGYDIGPANCLIDEWINIHQQKSYDENGDWAKQGKLNHELLEQMLNDDYFQKCAPKSTGREYFNHKWYSNFKEQFKVTSAIDIQTTLTHLTAKSIANTIALEKNDIEEIILMGGGAKNSYLTQLIYHYSIIKTTTSDEYGYDSDWIEAILFAFLAYQRINNKKIDLSSFTGSSKKLLLGDLIVVT